MTAPEAEPRDPISAQTVGPRIRLLLTQRCQGRHSQEAWTGVQETPAHSTLGAGTLGCSLFFSKHSILHGSSRSERNSGVTGTGGTVANRSALAHLET